MVHQEIMIYLYLNKGHSFSYVYDNRFPLTEIEIEIAWIAYPELICIVFRSLSVSCLVSFTTLWHHSFQLWWFQMALCRFWQISRCCCFFCVCAQCSVRTQRFTRITIRNVKQISDAKMKKKNQALLSFCSFVFLIWLQCFAIWHVAYYLDECRFWLRLYITIKIEIHLKMNVNGEQGARWPLEIYETWDMGDPHVLKSNIISFLLHNHHNIANI